MYLLYVASVTFVPLALISAIKLCMKPTEKVNVAERGAHTVPLIPERPTLQRKILLLHYQSLSSRFEVIKKCLVEESCLTDQRTIKRT